MNKLLLFLLTGFLSSLSLSWISLVSVGGLDLNVPHLFFGGLAIGFGLGRFSELWSHSADQPAFVFSVCYVLYLAAMFSSLFAGDLHVNAVSLLIKYTAYFGMFFILMVVLRSSALTNQSIAAAAYLGCALGIVAFLGFAVFVFYRAGRNFPAEFFSYLVQGDTSSLKFKIFLALFNYGADEVDRTADSFISAARANTITGAFVLYWLLVWIYRRPATLVLPGWLASLILWGVTTISLVVIIGSASRTNIATVFLTALVVLAARALSANDSRMLGNMMVVLFVVVCLAVLGVVAAPSEIGIYNMLAERFSSETLSEDSRAGQYTEAWARIKRRPFAGYGLGAGIDVNRAGGRVGQQVHNLFLASWYEAGIAGFAAAVAYYGCILLYWFLGFGRLKSRNSWYQSGLNPSLLWWLGLPCLPVVRAMFSGQAGSFTMMEWTCLAFFFGISARNSPWTSGERVFVESHSPVDGVEVQPQR